VPHGVRVGARSQAGAQACRRQEVLAEELVAEACPAERPREAPATSRQRRAESRKADQPVIQRADEPATNKEDAR